ncbi:hypothetical protein PgNI_05492 [Pyricularia grisea]|uniref:Uncharacterized protein n=1 Tax=Pyricularia grisea TaxID=148305 RepID=A0A6P8B520_PYRGI|nr:hypothetical protein PgNI_05492 [Pyricularia grisea]TLD10355.1 hypothetical protein PgNI_05492 [Pyricularia grisea]
MHVSITISLALALGVVNASTVVERMHTKMPIRPHPSGFRTVTLNKTSTVASLATGTAALNTTTWRQIHTGYLRPTPPTPTGSPGDEEQNPDDLDTTWATTADMASPTVTFTKTTDGVQQTPMPTDWAPLPTPSSLSQDDDQDDNDSDPKIGPWKIPGNGFNLPLYGPENNDTGTRTPFSIAPGPVIPDEDDFDELDTSNEEDIDESETPEGFNRELLKELFPEGLDQEEADRIRDLLKNDSEESKTVEEDGRKAQDALLTLANDFRRLRQLADAN